MMLRYCIKRLMQFIPALFIVSFLSFYISRNSPGDPVEILSQSMGAQGAQSNYTASQQFKDSIRTRLGLNLPLFYFSVNTASDCDTLYKVLHPQEQYALHRLSRTTGSWPITNAYWQNLDKLLRLTKKLNPQELAQQYQSTSFLIKDVYPEKNTKMNNPVKDTVSITVFKYPVDTITTAINTLTNGLLSLKTIYKTTLIQAKLDSVKTMVESCEFLSELRSPTILLSSSFSKVKQTQTSSNNYIPAWKWNGFNNQYHIWLFNVLKGDFGYSYIDSRPVAEKIWEKFVRTFVLVLLSVFLAYFISIPIALYCTKHAGKWRDKWIAVFLFALYAVPSFFFGTLLLYFFTNPAWFNWFPEFGFCDPEHYNPDWNFFERIYHTFPYMVLPLITFTYSSFAFTSRVLRNVATDVMHQDFIRTARAKGLSERRIMWRHVFTNSLLPVITTFVHLFPAAVGGSVIIETIFSYDGMGMASYEALIGKDHPMIVAIFSLAGLMTMIAYFIADLLYAWADPRIRLK